MNFGIYGLGEIKEAFIWRFDDFESAKAEALRLSEKYRTEVIVFKIIGSYDNVVLWNTMITEEL